MRFNWLILCVLLCPVLASAQVVGFCDKGTVCWTDGSQGTAATEIKFASDDVNFTQKVAAGQTRFVFAERFKTSKSSWICIQARHAYPNGTFSSWYVSDTEGVCNTLAAVMPGGVTPPPSPPPPGPTSPSPPPSGPVFQNIRQGKWTDPRTKKQYDAIYFDHAKADCASVQRYQEGRDTKTDILVCRK